MGIHSFFGHCSRWKFRKTFYKCVQKVFPAYLKIHHSSNRSIHIDRQGNLSVNEFELLVINPSLARHENGINDVVVDIDQNTEQKHTMPDSNETSTTITDHRHNGADKGTHNAKHDTKCKCNINRSRRSGDCFEDEPNEPGQVQDNQHDTESAVKTNYTCTLVKRDVSLSSDSQESKHSSHLDLFLTDFHDATLVTTSNPELKNISESVTELVQFLLTRVGEQNPRLCCKEVIPTGSFHDGTKILQPDEFDFLAVLEDASGKHGVGQQFGVMRECSENAGFAHVNLLSSEAQRKWKHVSKEGKLVSVNRGTIHSFREHFRISFHGVIHDNDGYMVEKPTGVLMLRGFSVSINGPECTVDATWKPVVKGSPDINISIDVCPALKSGQIDIIKQDDAPAAQVWDLVKNSENLYLIPKPTKSCRHCFKLVFAAQDQALVRALSENHKRCLLVLKYIAKLITSEHFCTKVALNSFSVKTALLHHSFFCDQDQSLGRCVLQVLQKFPEALGSEKMPSVFIQDRNIFRTLSKVDANVARLASNAITTVIDDLTELQDNLSIEGYQYQKCFNKLKENIDSADIPKTTGSEKESQETVCVPQVCESRQRTLSWA